MVFGCFTVYYSGTGYMDAVIHMIYFNMGRVPLMALTVACQGFFYILEERQGEFRSF